MHSTTITASVATSDSKSALRTQVEAQLSDMEEIVADIRQGRMVILVDDEDRENEGDLVMAAEAITPEAVNFMITHGRGLVCLPMSARRAEDLRLPPMVTRNEDDFGTAFTVSIDATAEHGVTTGISAADRATTIKLAAEDGSAADFHRPGHIFPLIARDGGTLVRTGHTEAAVDLAQLAGFAPVGVIVEIVGDDGEMLRLHELLPWAERHGLKISTIERLRDYRLQRSNEEVA